MQGGCSVLHLDSHTCTQIMHVHMHAHNYISRKANLSISRAFVTMTVINGCRRNISPLREYICMSEIFYCIVLVQAVVQVETIGEFGVYFMLFVVGLEFSPGKLRKVIKMTLFTAKHFSRLYLQVLIIAVTGSIAIVILMICGGLIVGYLVGIHQLQSSFVAACLSLSSTPLVVKFMQQSSTHLILPTKGVTVCQVTSISFRIVSICQ